MPHEALIGLQGDPNGHHPIFEEFVRQSTAEKQRNEPIAFGLYFQTVLTRLERRKRAIEQLTNPSQDDEVRRRLEQEASYDPSPNAASNVYHAMIKEPNHGFFRDPQNKNRIIGNTNTLDQVVRFMRLQATTTAQPDTMLMFVAPTSAGKSTLVNGIKDLVQLHARTSSEPVLGIKGCPIQEDPLRILPQQSRERLHKEYGIKVHGDLCSHCQKELHTTYNGDRGAMGVQAIPYSVATGIGIAKIDPKMTSSKAPSAQEDIDQAILKSNRGILEISELLSLEPAFLATLYDLIRGRRLLYHGEEQELDNVMIGHTTLESYKKFKDTLIKNGLDVDAFLRRMQIVFIPYLLSVSDEAEIYRSDISKRSVQPHISPQTLETIAYIGVSSRIRKSDNPDASMDVKIALYDGQNTEKLGQQDREKIEAEGILKDEGSDGLSPAFMLELLGNAIADSEKCVDPLSALATIEDHVFKLSLTQLKDRTTVLEAIKRRRTEYDKWLEKTIKRAFRPDYEEAAATHYNSYMEDIILLAQRILKKTDPITQEEVEIDEKPLRAIEEAMGITETAKHAFREKILRDESLKRRRGEKFDYTDIPGFEEALQKVLKIDVASTLLSLLRVPDEEESKKLREVTTCLVEKHGFCPHCAPRLLKHQAMQMRDKIKVAATKQSQY